ncbi:MAG: NAD(P)/FAD-dependent oxidoreductase [bacterium]
MNRDADVLILGAGIGGVALGALLAHRGLEVQILERNPFVGGRCVSYRKEGFTIDVFVHMFGRCEKGPYGEILRRVVRPDGIRWWHAAPESRPVFFMDEDPYPYPDPSFSTRADLAQVYRAFGLADEDVSACFRIWDEIDSMPYGKTFELDKTPYSHWLRNFTSNRTLLALEHQRVLIYSVVTSREASAGELIRTIQNAQRDANVGYPMGGCSAIPEAFCSIVREHGGAVRLSCPVARVLVEGGKALGVVLEDGSEVRAPLVVSNLGIRETMLRYVGPEQLPPEYAARVRSLTTGKLVEETPMGMIYLKLALDRPVIDAPLILRNVREGAFEGLFELMQGIAEDRPPKGYKGIHSFIPVPSNMDPSLAPPGRQLVNFYGLAPVESGNWEAWVEYHLGYLCGLYPDIRKHLMWYDFSTLNRISKYSGRLFPDIVGIVQSVGQVGKDRPDPVTPIQGLYLVGSDVGRDNIGTELAAESALRVADLLR